MRGHQNLYEGLGWPFLIELPQTKNIQIVNEAMHDLWINYELTMSYLLKKQYWSSIGH